MTAATAAIMPLAKNIAADIEREHAAAQQGASDAVKHAIACGRLLLQQKAAMRHGEFGKWLAANVDISRDTVKAYMRVALVPKEIVSSANNLSIRKLLAIPKTPAKAAKKKPAKTNKDAIAKRITEQLAALKQSDLTDPADFAGHLAYHARRLNPNFIPFKKGR